MPAVKENSTDTVIQQYMEAHKLWYLSEDNCLFFYFNPRWKYFQRVHVQYAEILEIPEGSGAIRLKTNFFAN